MGRGLRVTIGRRRLLGLGLGALGAAALAGCAPPGANPVNAEPTIPAAGPGEKITLTYWAWLKDLQKVADIWNAKNPNVQVEAVFSLGGNSGGYQKMYSALAAGGGPDLAQVELRSVPEFMLVGGLVDLARYGAEQYRSRYDEAAWDQVTFNGGVFAIPQDTGPMAWYYQPAVLAKVGGQPPTTWDEWASLAEELHKRDPSVYLEAFSVADASPFMAYAAQAGGKWFTPTENGWIVNLTDDATLTAARFFDKAIDGGYVQTGYDPYSPGWTAAAGNGQIAALTGASWGDALVETIGTGAGKWRVAPMPKWPTGSGSTALGGSSTAILANSRHPKEALDFAVWMTTSPEAIDALIKYCGIGWSPARDYIGAQRQQPSEFFSGQNYNTEIFVPAAGQQPKDWRWGPITQRTLNALSDNFRRKITAGQSLVDSLRLTQRTTVDTMRQIGLTVLEAK
jgi:multiple sugar transport system substrate-binding protein